MERRGCTYKNDLLDGFYVSQKEEWGLIITINGYYKQGLKDGGWDTWTISISGPLDHQVTIRTKLREIYDMGRFVGSSTYTEKSNGADFYQCPLIFYSL